jgi:Zn-finger nucleic acid-binding protein
VSSLASRNEIPTVPLSCSRCGGVWLRRGALAALYRSGALEELGVLTRPRREDDLRTGLCPEGHGILTRAKVAWQDPYYIERCSKCAGLWLDAGEWKRLAAQNLIDDIDELWEPAWRRQLQREHSVAALRADLRERLGAELVEKLESVAHELASTPHANVALAFLREEVRAGRRRSVTSEVDSE